MSLTFVSKKKVDDATEESLTFKDFIRDVKKLGSYFVKHGVKPHDVVVLFMANNVYYPVIYHAVMGIGAVTSPCNPANKPGLYDPSINIFL